LLFCWITTERGKSQPHLSAARLNESVRRSLFDRIRVLTSHNRGPNQNEGALPCGLPDSF
jgi:hypothetical protein